MEGSGAGQLPVEVLAVCFEYLPSIKDMCSARSVCSQWGGSDAVEDLGGAVRETLLTLNGESYFSTSIESPLFAHYDIPLPPFGKAGPLKLYLCMCGDQLEEISIGLGTKKDYSTILDYVAQYTPSLKVLRLTDLSGDLPSNYPGHWESGHCELSENFFLNPAGVWDNLTTIDFRNCVAMHSNTLHWLTTSSLVNGLTCLRLVVPRKEDLAGLPSALRLLPKLKSFSLSHKQTPAWNVDPAEAPGLAANKFHGNPFRLIPASVTEFDWGFSSEALKLSVLPAEPTRSTKTGNKNAQEKNVQDNNHVVIGPNMLNHLSKLTLRTHPVANKTFALLATQLRCSNLRALDLSTTSPSNDIAYNNGFRLLLTKGGPLSQLTELRVGFWIGECERVRAFSPTEACPKLKVFSISKLPHDAWKWGWGWTGGNQMLQDRTGFVHRVINAVLTQCVELEALYLPGENIQWSELEVDQGLAQRKLTILGLYGLRLSDSEHKDGSLTATAGGGGPPPKMETESFRDYLLEAPYIPLLKELNLYSTTGVTAEAMDAVAQRCHHLEQLFYSSIRVSSTFFKTFAATNGCLRVLHLGLKPNNSHAEVADFLSALTVWAPLLEELCIQEDDFVKLVPQLQSILHRGLSNNLDHHHIQGNNVSRKNHGGRRCRLRVGSGRKNSSSRDRWQIHNRDPNLEHDYDDPSSTEDVGIDSDSFDNCVYGFRDFAREHTEEECDDFIRISTDALDNEELWWQDYQDTEDMHWRLNYGLEGDYDAKPHSASRGQVNTKNTTGGGGGIGNGGPKAGTGKGGSHGLVNVWWSTHAKKKQAEKKGGQ